MKKKIIIIITVLSIVFGGIVLFWVSYSGMSGQQRSFKWQQQKLRDEMKMQRSKDTLWTIPMVGYSNHD